MKIKLLLRHNLAGKFSNHFLVFLINILIVRMLGSRQSGDYFNELYLLNFISFGFSLGLDFAVIRLIAQEPALAGRLKQMLLWIAAGFFLVFSLAATFMPGIQQPAPAMVLFTTGNLLLILFQGWLSAMKKFNTQNLILIATNLFFLIWLWINRDYAGNRYQMISLVYGGLFFTQGLIMYSFCQVPGEERKVTVSWPALIRSGFLIMISSLVYFAFLRIDNFFVEAYADPETLSNYVQCGKVGQYFLYFSSVVSSTILPFMREEGLAHSYDQWKELLRPYVLILVAAALFLALAGPFLFPFLFGAGFESMHFYMWILLPGYLCLGLLTLINAVYYGKGNIRAIFIGDLAGFIAVTCLDFLLVPSFGARGAAAISSVAYCLLFIYLFSGLRKQFERPSRDASIQYL